MWHIWSNNQCWRNWKVPFFIMWFKWGNTKYRVFRKSYNQLKCCKTSRKRKEDTRNISETDNGGEHGKFADRQVVHCFNDDFITDFRFTRNNNLNQIYYIYKCCNISDQIKTCYPSKSPSNKALYLKGHPILYQYGYDLSNIHLFQKYNGMYQNYFSCTKIANMCAKQDKK